MLFCSRAFTSTSQAGAMLRTSTQLGRGVAAIGSSTQHAPRLRPRQQLRCYAAAETALEEQAGPSTSAPTELRCGTHCMAGNPCRPPPGGARHRHSPRRTLLAGSACCLACSPRARSTWATTWAPSRTGWRSRSRMVRGDPCRHTPRLRPCPALTLTPPGAQTPSSAWWTCTPSRCSTTPRS